MALHPLRVAYDDAQARVAALEKEYSHIPNSLREIQKLYPYLQQITCGLEEAKERVFLERATAPDTDAGRRDIRLAEADLAMTERLFNVTEREFKQRWAEAPHWSLTDIALADQLATSLKRAQRHLKDCKEALYDHETLAHALERHRRESFAYLYRLNSGQTAPTASPSIITLRFTNDPTTPARSLFAKK